ncbi:MAG: ATP synthase subunit I [Bryobacteraceae bacterium]
MTSDLFGGRAIARMERIGLVLTVAGAIALGFARGVGWGAGFFCGAALSLLNFRWWKTLVGALGASGEVPFRGSAAILGLRYLLIGGAIYVIVKYLEVNLVAILLGLFVSIAAVIAELLYELIYAGN